MKIKTFRNTKQIHDFDFSKIEHGTSLMKFVLKDGIENEGVTYGGGISLPEIEIEGLVSGEGEFYILSTSVINRGELAGE